MATAEELAFLARIRECPEDDAPRLMFADWLDEQCDPRGEFIRLQCALTRLSPDDPRRADLSQREQLLQEKHQAAWSARLQGLAAAWTYRRGLIETIAVDAEAFLERGVEIFRHGPIRRVRFLDAARCFTKLVDSPLLGKIREIDLCGNYLGNGGINLLVRARQLQHLEVLHLGFNDLTDQGLRSLADISHFTNLRDLYLDDNRELNTPGIRALADSPYFSQLRLLDLSGNSLNEAALRVIINGESLKQLDSLLFHGNPIGDAGLESLAHSDLLKRMLARSPALDLSRNQIGPIGVRALANAPALEGVQALNLSMNSIGNTGLTTLAQSRYVRNLKALNVLENRISDVGVIGLARSRLPETLESINLTGNFITDDSIAALDNAAADFDWRKKIDIQVDAGLRSANANRPAVIAFINARLTLGYSSRRTNWRETSQGLCGACTSELTLCARYANL